jgi:hypothetical protein
MRPLVGTKDSLVLESLQRGPFCIGGVILMPSLIRRVA